MNEKKQEDNFYKIFFNKIKFVKEEETFFAKKSIIIFFVLYVGIPILISLIFFIVNQASDATLTLGNFTGLLNSILACVGLIVLSIDNLQKFVKEGFWLLVFFPIFGFISSFLGLIDVAITNDAANRLFREITLGDLLQLIFILVLIPLTAWLYFKQNQAQEKFNLINCFKKDNLLTTFTWILLLLSVASLLNWIISLWSTAVPLNEVSQNQNLIVAKLKSGNLLEVFITVFSILITAPIFEELIYRKTLAEITNNKWWVIIISSLFFAFLHIQQANDWQNIFLYFSIGIPNAICYYYLRNTVPIISLHFFWNLIVLINVFIK